MQKQPCGHCSRRRCRCHCRRHCCGVTFCPEEVVEHERMTQQLSSRHRLHGTVLSKCTVAELHLQKHRFCVMSQQWSARARIQDLS